MATLLFRLNDVPADEALEVRELLAAHDLDIYETHAGRWGISVAAIWLRDDTRLEEARRLIDDYQRERGMRVRAEHEAMRREGRLETFGARLRREPLRVIAYALFIALVLYLTLMPFLGSVFP